MTERGGTVVLRDGIFDPMLPSTSVAPAPRRREERGIASWLAHDSECSLLSLACTILLRHRSMHSSLIMKEHSGRVPARDKHMHRGIDACAIHNIAAPGIAAAASDKRRARRPLCQLDGSWASGLPAFLRAPRFTRMHVLTLQPLPGLCICSETPRALPGRGTRQDAGHKQTKFKERRLAFCSWASHEHNP